MPYEIDYLAIAPEIIVAITALAVILLDLFLKRGQKHLTGVLALVGMLAAAVPLIMLAARDEVAVMFDGAYVVDEFSLVLKALFIVAAYLVLLISVAYLESDKYYEGGVLLPPGGVPARCARDDVGPGLHHSLRRPGAGLRPVVPAFGLAQG